ncbi:hypothetical protein D3C87_1746700 [compost metagenome]
MSGVQSSGLTENLWRIPFKDTSQIRVLRKMAGQELRQWELILQMVMACMIWLEMFGSGLKIGIAKILS